MRKKETPNPSRVRGRGVEVSKTLFYIRQRPNTVRRLKIIVLLPVSMRKQAGQGKKWLSDHNECLGDAQ